MSTLNARANQAWRDMEAELEREDYVPNFTSEQDAWEEGWETGYKTAAEEGVKASLDSVVEALADVLPYGEARVVAAALRKAGVFREIGGVS